MLSLHNLLQRLLAKQIEFVLVGGLAAVAHGASTMTRDLDVCFAFNPENVQKLLDVLADIHPTVRAGEGNIPLSEYEVSRLAQLNNLYVKTDLGELDLLGSITGIGDYQVVKEHSSEIELLGFSCRIMDIESLIKAKQFMNRPKDQQVILELSVIQEKKVLG